MNKFTFRLDRVLEFRQAQARLEESHLARLHHQVSVYDQNLSSLAQQRETESRALLASSSVTGSEMEALSAHHDHLTVSAMQVSLRRTETQKALALQVQKTMEARRGAQLLDRLRARRFEEWRKASDREAENQAAENYLLRWKRQ